MRNNLKDHPGIPVLDRGLQQSRSDSLYRVARGGDWHLCRYVDSGPFIVGGKNTRGGEDIDFAAPGKGVKRNLPLL